MKIKRSTSRIIILLLLSVLITMLLVVQPWSYLKKKYFSDSYATQSPIMKFLISFIDYGPPKMTKKQFEEMSRNPPRNMRDPMSPGKRYKRGLSDDFMDAVLANWHVKIEGSIPDGVSYVVRVVYTTEKESKLCQRNMGIDNPWTGHTTPKSKKFSYYPKIENGNHSLIIPLNELRPDKGCFYFPYYVQLSINTDKGDNFNEYLFVKKRLETGEYQQVKNNIINVECRNNQCAQAPIQSIAQKNIKITQKLHNSRNKEYVLNIKMLSGTEQPAQKKK